MVMKLQPRDMRSYFARLKTVLEQNPHVMGVSRSERLIGEPWPTNSILPAGWDESETKRVMGNLVGLDFLETLGINLSRGRSFEHGRYRDSTNAIILNEKAVAHLGLEDPIGMQVDFFSRNGPRTVIGVVEDFNFSTLHEEIKPMVLVMPFVDIEHVYVRIHKGNPSEIIESIQSDWQKAAPMVPMDFRFLDDHLNNLYSNTTRLSYLINIFSMLAIFLSILGLISLVSLTVTNRMKEMSIRKVLGASTLLIMGYLSRTFFWIIGMAILLSFPAVHFFLDAWLADFAFRIDPGWEIYLGTLIILLVLSMAVVNMLAIKAAHANPSDVLRKED